MVFKVWLKLVFPMSGHEFPVKTWSTLCCMLYVGVRAVKYNKINQVATSSKKDSTVADSSVAVPSTMSPGVVLRNGTRGLLASSARVMSDTTTVSAAVLNDVMEGSSSQPPSANHVGKTAAPSMAAPATMPVPEALTPQTSAVIANIGRRTTSANTVENTVVPSMATPALAPVPEVSTPGTSTVITNIGRRTNY